MNFARIFISDIYANILIFRACTAVVNLESRIPIKLQNRPASKLITYNTLKARLMLFYVEQKHSLQTLFRFIVVFPTARGRCNIAFQSETKLFIK